LKKFEDILAECIDDIRAGEANIEDCLARYPSLRERLEPLLELALGIRETPDVRPSSVFKVKARVQLMEHIHERQAVTKWPWSRYNRQTKQITLRRRSSMVSVIVAIVLVLSAVGGGTAYASQWSLPGDALYSIKLGTEQVRMALPGDDAARAERALGFADRRVEEIVDLAAQGRVHDLGLAAEKYENALNMTMTRIQTASAARLAAGNVTGNVTARVAEATLKHLEVLLEVFEQVPEDAKPAIARAMERSVTGHYRAMEALEEAGVDVSQLPGIPARVRERLENILGGRPPWAGPPDDVTPGPPDDVTPGPPDDVTPGPPDDVTPGPPDHVTPGKP